MKQFLNHPITQLMILLLVLSCGSDDAGALSFEDQLDKDIEKIEKYLAENGIEASSHESGIRFVERVTGEGISPTIQDSVTVTYKGMYLNGTVFDKNSEGITFPLQYVIEAWQLMLPTMKEGGKLTMYAPSGYCYGTTGRDQIPPNAIMIFDVELITVE